MNRINDQQGLAMPVALLVMLVISLLAVALWHYGTAGIRQVENLSEENRAHYLARSAAEATLAYIMQDQISADVQNRIDGLVGEKTVTNGVTIDGEVVPVTVSVSPDGNNAIIITATAADNGTSAVVQRRLYKTPNLVAVGNSGEILTYDGTDWRDQSANPDTESNWTEANLKGITWGSPAQADSLLVAVGDDGTIITSPDGVTWTARESNCSTNLNDIAWGTVTIGGSPATMFVAVGEGGAILTSPDGIVWTSRNSGTSEKLNGVAWGNGMFVAVGENGTVLRSTNGSTWTTGARSGSHRVDWSDYDFNEVAWGNNMFLAVADRHRESWFIFTYRYYLWAISSSDGATWTRQGRDDSDYQNLITVGWDPVANKFGAAGEDGVVIRFENNGSFDELHSTDEFRETILGFTLANQQGWAVGHSRRIGVYHFATKQVTAYNLGQEYNLNDITSVNSASGGVWRVDSMVDSLK